MRMRKVLLFAVVLLMMPLTQGWSAVNQYPNPNRQTLWNNLTDSINTIGQTPQQAQMTKLKLHALRFNARVQSVIQAKRQGSL